ncbi:MAG: SRPBCC family protein [Thermoleophilia bacterium]|nr:SRPBCC family protein [Thermoleophilia bacterium]
MHRNEHTVEIDRPPADVFPHLIASEQRLAWMGALTESAQVTEGEPQLGTRFRDVFEDHGQRIEIDAEVVEWKPNERLATRLRGSAFEATARQNLEEIDGRTRLVTTIDTEYKSRIARLMAGVVTRHAQRRLEEDLVRLKQIVERES